MPPHNKDSTILKAAIEFGSEYTYTVKNGGLGPTLVVDAPSKKKAHIARRRIPTTWEGLYTIVVYMNEPDEETRDDEELKFQEDLPV